MSLIDLGNGYPYVLAYTAPEQPRPADPRIAEIVARADARAAEAIARIDREDAERRLRSAQWLSKVIVAMNTWPAPLADPPREPPRPRRRWLPWRR